MVSGGTPQEAESNNRRGAHEVKGCVDLTLETTPHANLLFTWDVYVEKAIFRVPRGGIYGFAMHSSFQPLHTPRGILSFATLFYDAYPIPAPPRGLHHEFRVAQMPAWISIASFARQRDRSLVHPMIRALHLETESYSNLFAIFKP